MSLARFQNDKIYFLKYYGLLFFITVLGVALLVLYGSPLQDIDYKPFYLLLLPLGAYLGVYFGALLHNAAHGSISPRWLNRALGEILGFLMLYGFLGWRTMHLFHHAYPDHPEFDPHPPMGKPYLVYAFSMQRSIRECLTRHYFRIHKPSGKNIRLWKFKNIFGGIGMVMRFIFIYLALGPLLFATLYLPFIVANNIFYTHFNWSTHIKGDDDQTIIVNRNESLLFRLLNWGALGVYFHANHHRNPKLPNPSVTLK